jgi:hypothetical protein
MCGLPDARMTAELIFNPIENRQRALDQGVPVPETYALQRRAGVASNKRVMTE